MSNEYRVSDSKIFSQRLGMILPIVMGSMSCIFGIILLAVLFLAPSGSFHLSLITIIGLIISCIFFLFGGLLQFLLALLNYWIAKTVRITTSPEGINFYSPGLELQTSWNNLLRIGKQKSPWGGFQSDSLVMKEPPTQKRKWRFALL
jgi:hypothetical protein